MHQVHLHISAFKLFVLEVPDSCAGHARTRSSFKAYAGAWVTEALYLTSLKVHFPPITATGDLSSAINTSCSFGELHIMRSEVVCLLFRCAPNPFLPRPS